MAKGDIYVATETFATEVEGVSQVIHAGLTRVREGHSLLKAFPDYFAPVDTSVDYDVEQATAEPGVKRGEQQPVQEQQSHRGETEKRG